MHPTYEISLTPRAEADLKEIRDYLEREAPNYVVDVALKIDVALKSLKQLPHRYKVYLALSQASRTVHCFPVLSYLIYYRIQESEKIVWIQSVRHGRRRQPRRFR